MCLERLGVHDEQHIAGLDHGAFNVFTLVEKTFYPGTYLHAAGTGGLADKLDRDRCVPGLYLDDGNFGRACICIIGLFAAAAKGERQ